MVGSVNIFLVNAIAGDRFVSGTGWTVLSNHDGWLKLVSDDGATHEGRPDPGMTVTLTNRDDSLDHASAIANVMSVGLNPRVVSVE